MNALEKVQEDIDRVEAEISEVKSQLGKALEPDDRQYYRKETERLGKREEQLRTEKEQLRAKELLLLQPAGADSDRVDALSNEVARLKILQARSLTTTRQDEEIGKEYLTTGSIQTFSHVNSKPTVPIAADKFLQAFLEAVMKSTDRGVKRKTWRAAASAPTILQLLRHAFSEKLKEVQHMQPCLVPALRAAAEAVGSSLVLVDTHASGLQHPTANIDCSGMACHSKAWSQLVLPMEFKLEDGQEAGVAGQIVNRCQAILDTQPSRQFGFALAFSTTSMQIFRFRRGEEGLVRLTRSGWQPLTIGSQNGGSWQQLMWYLAATPEELGHCIPAVDSGVQLGGHTISNCVLLQQGSAQQGTSGTGPGSLVYRCDLEDGQPAILKLTGTLSPREGELLSRITAEDVAHVVRLVSRGRLAVGQTTYTALLLRPVGQHLDGQTSISLIAQVLSDAAEATGLLKGIGILNRDYSPWNILEHKERGLVIDFSAGKEARSGEETSPSGKPWSLTGTPLFCAISVLDGQPHTISSALESLFYSMLYWVSNGRFPDVLGEPHSTLARAELRLGQMSSARLRWLTTIPLVAQEFVKALHALFFARQYNEEVTVKQFKSTCNRFIA